MLRSSGPLNEVYLPLYETPEGRKVYDDTLEVVQKNFPQYVEEIQGTADGAKVPFHKVSLFFFLFFVFVFYLRGEVR